MNSPLRQMTAHNALHGLLYQATSAEYIALCVQTYQLARHAFLDRLRSATFRKPAVIFDLDETLLDNSAYAAWQIRAGHNYEDSSWNAWCNASESGAVPGGFEFVRFVQDAGATPIFITSRSNATRIGTARNLMRWGALTEDESRLEEQNGGAAEHVFSTRLFMKGMLAVQVDRPNGTQMFDLSNKYMQRIFCSQVRGYEIVLSIGDNLSDYAEYYGRVFDEKGNVTGKAPDVNSRRTSALQDMALFGRDFILIPNATYGSWLGAFEFNRIGASDELASTPSQVREGLHEPQKPFVYDCSKTVTAEMPKLSEKNLKIWGGPPPPKESQ